MGNKTQVRKGHFNRAMALAVAAGVAVTGGVQVAAPADSVLAAAADAQVTDQVNEVTFPLTPEVPAVEETTWTYLHYSDTFVSDKPSSDVFVVVSSQETEDGEFTLKDFMAGRDNVVIDRVTENPSNEDFEADTTPLSNAVPRGEELEFDPSSYIAEAFKSVTLMPNGDLVVKMQPGVTRAEGLFLKIHFSEPTNGSLTRVEPTSQFITAFTSGVELPDVKMVRKPYGDASDGNEWGFHIPMYDTRIGSHNEGDSDNQMHASFPRLGQPEGATIVDVGSPYQSNRLIVPGQGNWTISPASAGDSPLSDKAGFFAHFLPEEGFTGVPTPPRVGVRDYPNYSQYAQLLGPGNPYHESPSEEAEWFFFYNTVAYPEPATDAENYTPEARQIVTTVGNPAPEPRTGIENFGDLPKGTTVTWDEAPKTGKPGLFKPVATVSYPDGSTEKVNIPLLVTQDLHITKVVENNGKYDLYRSDNPDKVFATIDPTTGSVTNVKPDGKGNIVITVDGKDQTVALDQVKVTESNPGKQDNKITLTFPDGKTVTFNQNDTFVTDIKWNEEEGLYEVYRNDVKGVWKTIDLSDLRNRVKALEDKDSPSREEFNAVKNDLSKFKTEVNNNFEQVRGDVNKLRADLTALEARVTDLEGRVTNLEDSRDKWAKCYSGVGVSAVPIALSIPLYVLSQTRVPAIEQVNSDIQRQLGVYNPELARMWHQYGGVLEFASALLGLAGTIGAIAYAASECQPYNETDAVKDTPLGKLSSDAAETFGSSRPSADAPASDAEVVEEAVVVEESAEEVAPEVPAEV